MKTREYITRRQPETKELYRGEDKRGMTEGFQENKDETHNKTIRGNMKVKTREYVPEDNQTSRNYTTVRTKEE